VRLLINNERISPVLTREGARAGGGGRSAGFKEEKEGSGMRVQGRERGGPYFDGPSGSAMARPSVFSGNSRKRNIRVRNALLSSLSLSLSLSPSRFLPPSRPSLIVSLLTLLHSALSSLPVYPPRRRFVSVSLPRYHSIGMQSANGASVVKFLFRREWLEGDRSIVVE